MPVVAVLWGLALLTAISLSLLWSASTSYSLAHSSFEIAGTNATVEAGVNRAVAALFDPRPERRWRVDGTPQTFEFDGVLIKISIQDELGKIDINQADQLLLANLLQAAGLDAGAASSLADKIIDWRTAAPLKRLNGAKDQDYRAAGSAFEPRNGAFQSVDELRLVMGMTPVLFQKIEPALTVYSGQPAFDAQVAPREALQALPGMTLQNAEATVAARSSERLSDGSISGGLTALHGRAFTIRAAFERDRCSVLYDVTVRLTENPNQPYWVLNWEAK